MHVQPGVRAQIKGVGRALNGVVPPVTTMFGRTGRT
jgi:hypothetical protein